MYKILKPFEKGLFTGLVPQKFNLVGTELLTKQVEEAQAKGLTLLSKTDNRCYGYYQLACGHKTFLHYGAVRKARTNLFKCKSCLDLKLAAEAEEVGIKYIKGLSNNKKSHIKSYQFPCGHILQLQTGNVRAAQISCTSCKEEKYKSEATERGLLLLQKAGDGATYNYLLPCGHTKAISLENVRTNSWKCRECQEQRYEQEAAAVGLIMNRDVKSYHHDYRNYTLPCGCSKDISIFCVRRKSFECKTHSERTIDFSKPISVYLVELNIQGDTVLKLGFSMDVKGRFVRYGLQGTVSLVAEQFFEHGQDAVNLEKFLHSKYANHRLHKDDLRQYMVNGFTECYPVTLREVLISELKNNGQRT